MEAYPVGQLVRNRLGGDLLVFGKPCRRQFLIPCQLRHRDEDPVASWRNTKGRGPETEPSEGASQLLAGILVVLYR